MIRMFGKGKLKDPPPDITQVIRKVDDRAESVGKKVATLELELKKYKDQLVRMRDGPAKDNVKQKATRVLKQKRMYESQVESLRNQSFNMEQTNFATEAVKDTKATVTAMRKGVKSFKKEILKIDIDKIEDLQDEMVDLLDFHEEVREAMGRTYGMPDIDDDELQQELDALGDELALDNDSSYLDEIKTEIKTPNVPIKDPGSKNTRENDNTLVDEFGLPKLSAL